jgi:aminopeptidase N
MRAKSFLEGGSLSGDLRGAVLHLAGRHADIKMWERLHDRARKTSDTQQKQILYGALASASDIALAKRALQLSLTGELPSNPSARMVGRVAGEGGHPELALAFAKEHLGELLALLSASAADDYVAHLFRHFSDAARAEELIAFTKANLPPEAARATAIAVDDILFSAEFKARILPQFAAYEQTDGATNQRGKPKKKAAKSQ